MAPSELDDALAVWLPDEGLLCGGAATPGFTIPNIGTPLRTQRFTIRWADTLDRLADLGATRLLTEFGPMLEGDDIGRQLSATSEALRWLREEVVSRMNRGMDDAFVVSARTLKAELCRARAKEVEPFVSKSCYRTSARLLDDGQASWTRLT